MSLVDGVVLRPLNFAGGLTAIPPVPRAALGLIIGVPALLAVARLATTARPSWGTRLASALVRMGAAAALIFTTLATDDWPGHRAADFGWFVVALALSALVLVPMIGRRSPDAPAARVLIAPLAVAHSLHAFPIAGVQQGLAEAIPLLAASILLADGGRELCADPTAASTRHRALATAPLLVALGVVIATTVGLGRQWIERFDTGTRLELAGASSIRGERDDVRELRAALRALSHCDQFFAYPGYASHYGFVGSQPPTGWNGTLWDLLLTAEEQEGVVDALEATDGVVCVLRIDGAAPMPPIDGPLEQYLERFTELSASGRGWQVLSRSR